MKNFFSDNLYVILAVVGLVALGVAQVAFAIYKSGGFI